jgi:LysR family transcriptional regulator, hca operon transcriptional activator
MELRHLRYFVALAEHLNFTRAAASLHIAQPALSVQIRNLETEIGAPLLLRDGRGIELTEAGRVFLNQARKTLADAARGITLARQAANGEIGHLSIGYNVPAGFRVFPEVIPAFKKRWPNVRLTFHNLKIAQQLDGLRNDELDLGFVWLPIPTEGFEVQELIKEPLVAVLPTGHRLASAATVAIKDLAREPLILMSPILDPESYAQIQQLFARAGAPMNIAYELENSLSMINFVAMGIGCSLLPDYARNIRQNGVVYKPLRSPNLVKTLAMIRKKGRSELAESFSRFTADTLLRSERA